MEPHTWALNNLSEGFELRRLYVVTGTQEELFVGIFVFDHISRTLLFRLICPLQRQQYALGHYIIF